MAEFPRTPDEQWESYLTKYRENPQRTKKLIKVALPGDIDRLLEEIPDLLTEYTMITAANPTLFPALVQYAGRTHQWEFLDLLTDIPLELIDLDDPEVDAYLIRRIPTKKQITTAIQTRNSRFFFLVLPPNYQFTAEEIQLAGVTFTPEIYQAILDNGVKLTPALLDQMDLEDAHLRAFLYSHLPQPRRMFNQLDNNLYNYAESPEEVRFLLQSGVYVSVENLLNLLANRQDLAAEILLDEMTLENINPAYPVTEKQMINYVNGDGTLPLADVKNLRLAERLLAQTDPEKLIAVTEYNETLLHQQANHPDILQLLLNQPGLRAQLEAETTYHKTALHLTTQRESVRLLLAAGAILDKVNSSGATMVQDSPNSLSLLAYLDYARPINLSTMKDLRTLVNYRKSNGLTVLGRTQVKEIALRLLAAGAELNVRQYGTRSGSMYTSLTPEDLFEVIRAATPANFNPPEALANFLVAPILIRVTNSITTILEETPNSTALSFYLQTGVKVDQPKNLFNSLVDKKKFDLLDQLLTEVGPENLTKPFLDVLNQPTETGYSLIYSVTDLAAYLHLVRLGVYVDDHRERKVDRLDVLVSWPREETSLALFQILTPTNFRRAKSLSEFINLPFSQKIGKKKTIAYFLTQYQQPETIQYLLDHGAYLDLPQMYLFSRPMGVDKVKLILENSTRANFSTGLTMADLLDESLFAVANNYELTSLYLQHGAYPLSKDEQGKTLIHFGLRAAEREQNLNYLELLAEHLEAEQLTKLINRPNEEGEIVFPYTTYPPAVRFFLDHGAIIDGTTDKTMSLLDVIFHQPDLQAEEMYDLLSKHVGPKNFTQVANWREYLNRSGQYLALPLEHLTSLERLSLFQTLVQQGASLNSNILVDLARANNLAALKWVQTELGAKKFTQLIQEDPDPILSAVTDPVIARFLLDQGARITQKKKEVTNAAELENVAVFRVVLERAPPDWIDLPVKGKQALLFYQYFPQILSLLVEEGVSLQVFDEQGNSPLFFSLGLLPVMTQANLPTMELHEFLDHQNHNGETALMSSIWAEAKPEEIENLLRLGASIDLVDNDGRTALSQALQKGREDIAALLLDDQKDWIMTFGSLDDYVNATITRGQSTVQLAVTKPAILAKLLSFGAIADRLYEGKTPLQWAVEKDNLESVKQLLAEDLVLTHFPDYQAYLDSVNLLGNTALLMAVKLKRAPIVLALLQAGATVDLADAEGHLPWMIPGHGVDLARFFDPMVRISRMTYQEYLNYPMDRDQTGLYQAIRERKTAAANFLLDQGARIDLRDNQGNNALMVLVNFRLGLFPLEKEWKKLLLRLIALMKKHKLDVNSQNRLGDTALTLALIQRQPGEIILLLLQARLDPNLADATGDVPLNKANCSYYYTLLLEYGADPNLSPNGYYPLAAALHNARDGVPILLAFGADPNAADFLTMAGANGDLNSFNLLLSYGARLPAYPNEKTLRFLAISEYPEEVNLEEIVDDENNTRLMAAIRNKKSESTLKRLIRETSQIDAQNEQGETALFLAVQNDNLKAVQLLLAAGANPLIKSQAGMSSLKLAEDSAVQPAIYEALAYQLVANQIPEVEGQLLYQPGGKYEKEGQKYFEQQVVFECGGTETRAELDERLEKLGFRADQFASMSNEKVCAYLKWYNQSDFVLDYEAEVANMCLSNTPRFELISLAKSFGFTDLQFRDQSKEKICAYLKRYTQVVLRSDQTYRPTLERTPFVHPGRIRPLPIRKASRKTSRKEPTRQDEDADDDAD